MPKKVYHFQSIVDKIIFVLFFVFVGVLTYLAIFKADEKNFFSSSIAMIMFLLSLIFMIYSFINKLIIYTDTIVYYGFRKHIINKTDIINVECDGHRVIINTNKKKYNIDGYNINRWSSVRIYEKNSKMAEDIINSLKK